MAAGQIPSPTTGAKNLGPCAPNCHAWTRRHRPGEVMAVGESHRDCQELRTLAANLCRLCHHGIGYDRLVYMDPNDPKVFVHASCLEKEVLG